MPIYATKQNLIDQYGSRSLIELTDRDDPPTGEINDTILEGALLDADVKINSYIAKRYTSPVSGGSPALRRVAEQIAYYYLHRDNYPDTVRKAYEDAVDYLKQISRGDVVLDIEGVEPTSSPAQAMVEGPERIFSRESLKVY